MPKSLREVPVLRRFVEAHQDRLTARGRYLFWTMLTLGLLGLNTRQNQIYKAFAVAAGLFLLASVFAFLRRPRVRLDCQLPFRTTALAPVSVKISVVRESRELFRELYLSFPSPSESADQILFKPREIFLAGGGAKEAQLSVELQALRRGRYLLRGPSIRATDPLRLTATLPRTLPDQALLVYPRFYSLERFMVPAGRRYQPGGIPLASNTGDSAEFVGTREYREGDPVKNIHWKSWARVGHPVVKEYQEEYFCRLALILDTFLPRQSTPREERTFEASISVVASIANYFSQSDYIVDILAAGPNIYEVSAGRSLAYLENILDVLACLEPCFDPPFEAVGPPLFDKLAQITSVVAVLQDWDEGRESFLRCVKALGSEVRAIVVREGPTSRPWQHAAEALGEISVMTPDDVERALAQGAAARQGARPAA